MQTDPNWSNFLWNSSTRQVCVLLSEMCIAFIPYEVSLVDFGATRKYTKEFIDDWLHLLQAAAAEDRNACAEWSLKLGYLTGGENEVCVCFCNSNTLLSPCHR